MKRILIAFIILGIGYTGAKAWDFAEPNEDGDTIYYIIKNDSVVSLDCWMNFSDSVLYEIDTLRLPESVMHNHVSYRISYDSQVFNIGLVLDATKASPRTLLLPKTYRINRYGDLSAILQISGKTNSTRLQNWAVEDKNPTLASIDGVLFSKNRDTLIAYPIFRTGSYRVPQRVKCITSYAFTLTGLDTLVLPEKNLVLKNLAIYQARTMTTFRYPDYITRLEGNIITADSLKEITFGSELEYIGGSMLPNITILEKVICRAITPPSTNFSDFNTTERITLYVPRNSITQYRQALGWNSFSAIEPIEPPIVTGVDTASVSWVQNFSATGYVWTLYTDEARTQRFMSLTFDANGHLTHIDINSSHMPARMPALYSEDGEEEKRFAEYYSFTISGLSPETRYYYTRQSISGTTVIDEETGSFETLSNETTGLNPCNGFPSDPQKMIKDGQVLIRSGNATYNLEGTSIRK